MRNLRPWYRKPLRKIISYMFNLKEKQALANQICGTHNMEYMYIITQNERKCQKHVKMLTSKWHQKQ